MISFNDWILLHGKLDRLEEKIDELTEILTESSEEEQEDTKPLDTRPQLRKKEE